MHGKTYSRFVIREREGRRPRNVACNDLKRWRNVSRAQRTLSKRFHRISNPVRISRISRPRKRLPSDEIRPFVELTERKREQSPLARIVATFRQWEPRIPRLKRSLVSSSSYNVAFSTTSRRTANNSLGCFQPSPSSTGLKRTP